MKQNYSFRLDKELIEKLDRLAEQNHRTRSNMIEILIIEATENDA